MSLLFILIISGAAMVTPSRMSAAVVNNGKNLFTQTVARARALASSMTAAVAFTGTITGTVYLDYNQNGAKDTGASPNWAVDTGVANVTVTAYDASGNNVGSATSGSTGTYSLAASGTGPYRIEFTNLPAGYYPSSSGANNATTVRFVPDGASSNIDLGIAKPSLYSQNNPLVATNFFNNGDNTGTTDALVAMNYDRTGTLQRISLSNQIGSTWGLAWRPSSKTLFASAVLKRHTGLGPGKDGTRGNADDISSIYVIDYTAPGTNGAGNVVTGQTINVNSFAGVNVGANPRVGSTPANDLGAAGSPNHDYNVIENVGKRGLGGLALSEDGNTLYAVNLNSTQPQLLAMNVSNLASVSLVSATNIPNPGCPAGDGYAPWAVRVNNGQVYVGTVCTAQQAGNVQSSAQNLRAYVQQFSGSSFTNVDLDSTTANNYVQLYYDRSCKYFTNGTTAFPATRCDRAEWTAWNDTFTSVTIGSQLQVTGIQPILSDIEFDPNGAIVLGLMDRRGHQGGVGNYSPTSTDTSLYEEISAGATLKVCNISGAYVPEGVGSCTRSQATVTDITNTSDLAPGAAGIPNTFYANSTTTSTGDGHGEVFWGGLSSIPGSNELVGTVMNPNTGIYYTGGWRWYSHTTGATSANFQVYAGGGGVSALMGKANGLGDVVMLTDPAPLQIGNRVWNDTNGNGVQDPNENGIQNVAVELWNTATNTQVGATTTDASGNYVFGGPSNLNMSLNTAACGTSTNVTESIAASGDDAEQATVGGTTNNTSNTLNIGNTNAFIGLRFTSVAIPKNAVITSASVTFTSNANISANGINVNLQAEDVDNSTAFGTGTNDISNRPRTTASVNWTSTAGWTNGATTNATTPSLTSLIQAVVNRSGWASGNNLNLIISNNGSTGERRAFSVDSGTAPTLNVTYQICSNHTVLPSTAYEIRVPNISGGSKQTALGTNNLTSANTDSSTNGDLRDSDATVSSTTAVIALTTGAYGANNHTYDFGFTAATPTFSVGNRVWYDTDNDGVIDAGEVGISGVTVDLLNSGGTQIATTTTDTNGYYRFDSVAQGSGYRIRVRGSNFGSVLSGFQNTTGATTVTDQRDNGVDPASNNPTLNHVLSASFNLGFTQPIVEPDVTFGNPATDKGAHSASGDVTDNLTVDFGFYRTQIGNLVFLDNNNNGVFDNLIDAGLAGALVALYQSDGTTIVPVGPDGILGTSDDTSVAANQFTTTSSGAYLFQGLLPGSYIVKVTPPLSYRSANDTTNSGTPNSGTDHDDNGPGTGSTQVTSGILTLTAGSATNGATVTNATGLTANPTADFGFTPSAPSAVKLAGFNAYVQTGGIGRGQRRGQTGVVLQWSTGYEVDNLGFNVYREENGQRVLLNRALIAGSALQVGEGTQLQSGNNYEWDDARGAAGQQYWLEEVDLSGERTWHGPVFANVAIEGRNAFNRAIAGRTVLLEELNDKTPAEPQTERAESLDEPAGVIEEDANGQPGPTLAEARISSATWSLPNQRAVKLAVRKAGWYRVTAAELATAGFDTTNLNLNSLSLMTDGQAVPFKLVKAKTGLAAIEFYGTGLDTLTTDTRIYWLSATGSNVLALSSSTVRQPTAASVNSFISTVERKDRSTYYAALLNQEAENWFGALVTPSGTTQTLTTRSLDTSSTANVELEVKLQGVTQIAHNVRVELNGQLVGSLLFVSKENVAQKFSLPAQWLREGENQIRLTSTGGASDYNLVDYLRLNYARSYKASNDCLNFTLASGQSALVAGFTSPNVRLLQLPGGSRTAPRELEIKTQQLADGTFGFTLTGEGGAYLALTDAKLERPASLKLDQPSNWRAYSKAADFLIVTHGAFKASADRLAQARATQGWQPVVVDVEDAFDEFAFGTRTPQAIRDLIEQAQTKWPTKLRAVLLIGAGHYDPRNYSGTATEDFIPVKLADTTLLESVSENWFTDLNNDTMSDIPLGRLPVRTVAQADAVVTKLLNYKPEATWRSALLVSDYSASGIDFPAMSRQIATALPAGMTQQFIDRKDGTAADIRNAIVQSINTNKPSIVNWSGHGSTDRWTGDGLLTMTEASALTNAAPSVWVMMTCLNGYFINPTPASLSEAVLLNPTGGAVAVVASSTMSVPQPQLTLNQTFYNSLFGTGQTFGEALQAAKQASSHWEIRQTYVLLGDPTMRLNLAK